MKMLNKKGFVLVETLIVTAFVVTLFIIVYQNIIPYVGEYEKMDSYDDVDSVYASNLMKNLILKEANLEYIDDYLNSHTYIDITDCSNTSIYKDLNYCSKLKNALSITNDDYILITNYDISNFRDEVKQNDFFDSGKLSNFRSYINSVSNVDSFYNSSDKKNNLNGKYRLFMTRTVTNSDLSTSVKYVNIGIFLGEYKTYRVGDTITFNPGDGEREFYVLKNSPSTDPKVTLILANNLDGVTNFNNIGVISYPDSLLTFLNQKTSNWNNTDLLTDNDQYMSANGYIISYDGYHARLLDENDLYPILGCESNKDCFDTGNIFPVQLTDNLKFLYNNLKASEGYWLASSIINNNELVWIIQNKQIIPTEISNSFGVRPVVVVDKSKLK